MVGEVFLPDIVVVHDWLEKHKPILKIDVKIESRSIITESNYDQCLIVLMMNFCIALRKGEFKC
jgi:hypothetical protein